MDTQARICIVNLNQAYIYLGGFDGQQSRVVSLWHADGNLRHLVLLWLQGSDGIGEARAASGPALEQNLLSIEDTQEIKVAG